MMKRAASILFVLVLLLSGLHITVAKHFCGGNFVASKISLSGSLASCGMENSDGICPVALTRIASHCCDDKVNVVGTIGIYTGPLLLSQDYHPEKLNDLYNTAICQLYSSIHPKQPYTNYHPPGIFNTKQVKLENICVFRI
jgi:hypothetical protein